MISIYKSIECKKRIKSYEYNVSWFSKLKSFIIAEIASNWEGNFSKAKKLIQESKNAGANAVKFQMWRANDLYDHRHPQWKFIKKSELTFERAKKLKLIADNIGIEFFCSAFYPEAINFLESIGVKRYKIASRTCLLTDPYSLETLKEKAHTGKPVIISMGMGCLLYTSDAADE